MIVVKVELHNANTGEVSELARAIIANVGGTRTHGDYRVALGEDGEADNSRVWNSPTLEGSVRRHARLAAPVWSLVAKALAAVGFGAEVGR